MSRRRTSLPGRYSLPEAAGGFLGRCLIGRLAHEKIRLAHARDWDTPDQWLERVHETLVRGSLGCDQEHGVVRRDRLLRIGERHEVVLGDFAIARESSDEVDLAADD